METTATTAAAAAAIPAIRMGFIASRLCKRLARVGVTRRASEGPVDFAARAITLRPQLRPQVEGITAMYVALRYGEGGALTDNIRSDFRRAVRAFRPR